MSDEIVGVPTPGEEIDVKRFYIPGDDTEDSDG